MNKCLDASTPSAESAESQSPTRGRRSNGAETAVGRRPRRHSAIPALCRPSERVVHFGHNAAVAASATPSFRGFQTWPPFLPRYYRYPYWFSETGQWWACTDVNAALGLAQQAQPQNLGATTYGPTGGAINVLELRGRAADLAVPPPLQARKSTADGVASIVQVPTWFWIDPSWWRPYTGQDTSASGRMTVTVEATPADSIWETGEGTITNCGPGLPFIPDVTDPDLRGVGVCSWTYRHSSGWVGHPYQVTAEVRSERNWTMTFNNNGLTYNQDAMPDITQTAGWAIETEEVLAVASAGRAGGEDDGFP